MSKNEKYIKLINTRRWMALRRLVLSKHPLCERCEQNGRVEAAVEVHHIVPVESVVNIYDMARLCYSPTNLMALCHNCHKEIHKEMNTNRKERKEKQLAEFRRVFGLDD